MKYLKYRIEVHFRVVSYNIVYIGLYKGYLGHLRNPAFAIRSNQGNLRH